MITLITLDDLLKRSEFYIGLTMGFNICQKMILNVHERNEPLVIDDKLYYILSGDRALQQMIDTVCNE